jgi:hypothetical protein
MTQIEGHRRWENRPIEREYDRGRARSLRGVVLGLVVAFAPVAAYLFQQNECLELNYAVDGLRREQDRLLELERRLSLRKADLESLEQIENWALRKHGLTRPAHDQVVVLHNTPTRPGHLVADGR